MSTSSHEKRLRVQGPRSSGGCQTCKTRHIKCDENRPQCNRCVKAGRTCAYTPQAGPSYKQHVIVYTVSKSPSPFPDLDEPTQRALHHYRVEAALAITYPFHCELWSQVVVQMSEEYSFVRSTLVALSNMYETYQQAPSARAALEQNSLAHYNRAIQGILEAAAGPNREESMDAILMSCMMFYTLDSLRGSWSSALRHALSGMQMLGERQGKQPQRENSTITTALQDAFLRLPHQLLELGGLDEFTAYRRHIQFERPMPSDFATIEEAYTFIQIIYNRVQHIITQDQCPEGKDTLIDSETTMPAERQREVEAIKTRMSAWDKSFSSLQQASATHESNPDPSHQRRLHQAMHHLQSCHNIITLTLHHLSTTGRVDLHAILSSALQPLIHDHNNTSNTTDTTNTNTNSRSSSSSSRNSTDETTPPNNFSLYICFLPTLFRFATQGSRSERRTAFDLLRASQRREGAWDNTDAIRIAERVLAVKDGAPGQRVDVLAINFCDGCKVRYRIGDAEGEGAQIYEEEIGLEGGVLEGLGGLSVEN